MAYGRLAGKIGLELSKLGQTPGFLPRVRAETRESRENAQRHPAGLYTDVSEQEPIQI